ncbi:hypothetical protein [Lysinibacillus sp. TE18511]
MSIGFLLFFLGIVSLVVWL